MRRLKVVTLKKPSGIEKKEGCATRDHLVHFGYVNVTAFKVRIRENNTSTKSWSSSCSYSRIIKQKQLQAINLHSKFLFLYTKFTKEFMRNPATEDLFWGGN